MRRPPYKIPKSIRSQNRISQRYFSFNTICK